MSTKNSLPTFPGTNASKNELIEHIKELHKAFTALQLSQVPEVEVQDNEFARTSGLVTLHANKPAEFKDSWATPRIAEIEVMVHTELGTLVCKDIEIIKLENKPMVTVPSESYEKDGKKVYKDHLKGRTFKDSILSTLASAIKGGFNLIARGRKVETKEEYDVLMGLTNKTYIPKDQRQAKVTSTKDNKDNATTALDKAKSLNLPS